MSRDITVLFPTLDRAGGVARTLEDMARCDRAGLDVGVIVVDNGSRDGTREVVESFADRIPVQLLDEPEPGKNRALNRGLDEGELGEIVLFTDDDVTPAADWFQVVAASAARWPDTDVFGGSIEVVWPTDDVPGWARDPYVQEFGFAVHAPRADEGPYAAPLLPFGPNFWVRRRALEGGPRFAEQIGPHPTNRILGDETMFLRELRDAGHSPVFVPGSRVGHRIQASLLDPASICRRAITLGRGVPYSRGLPRRELLARSPHLWRLVRRASLARFSLQLLLTRLVPDVDARTLRAVHLNRNLGYERECLSLAASAS